MSVEPGSPAAIEQDIEQTREELSRTVDELASRLDVKSQARRRVVAARDAAQAHPTAVVGGGAAVAAGVAAVMAARRRRR